MNPANSMSRFPAAVVAAGGRGPLASPCSSLLAIRSSSRHKAAAFVGNGRLKRGDGGQARNLRGFSRAPRVGFQFPRGRRAGLHPRGVAMASSTASVDNSFGHHESSWTEEAASRRGGGKELRLQMSRFVAWANQKMELSPPLVAVAIAAFVLGELWVYGFTVLRFLILGVALLYFVRTLSLSGFFQSEFQSLRRKAALQLQNFTGFWQAATATFMSSSSPESISLVDNSRARKTVERDTLNERADSESTASQGSRNRDFNSVDSLVNSEGNDKRDVKRNSPSLVHLMSTISTVFNSTGGNSIRKVESGIKSIRRDLYSVDPVGGVESNQRNGTMANVEAREKSVGVDDDSHGSETVMRAEYQNSGVMDKETPADLSQQQSDDQSIGPSLGPLGDPNISPQSRVEDALYFPSASVATEYLAVGSKSNSLETREPSADAAELLPVSSNPLSDARVLDTDPTSARNTDGVLQVERTVNSGDPWRDGDWAESRGEYNWTFDYDQGVYEIAPMSGQGASPDAAAAAKERTGTGGRFHSHGTGDFWGKNAGASEQRGSLTKRKAMGKGSNSGSTDDWDDNMSQGRGRRTSSLDGEKQPVVREFGPGSSRGGQSWEEEEQSYSSGRVARRDDDWQTWRGGENPADSVTDVYGLDATRVRRPQTLNGDTELGTNQSRTANQDWPVDDRALRRDTSSLAGGANENFSSQEPRGTDSRSRDFSFRPQQTRRSGESEDFDETGSSWRERKTMDEWNSRNVDISWDDSPSQDRGEYRPEDENPTIRSTGAPSPSPARREEMEQSLALERSRQADSVQIERYLDEAEALLEEGMQGLEGRIEVGVAESMLYEAAKLFERASDLDPTDLTATGQWGNTLLVHGELKLKVSQQIRTMLPSSKPSFSFRGGGRGNADREREEMEMALQQVCEECEDLLVEAGRKYRRALSLDRTDVRALYNWGLALCYRGQLISEEGGERAIQDADKVYLAATDKFEAMLGISQDYAAGALLNWGLAMRDRSRLRPMGDKERVQLLLQARELFQDAVRLDPNYGQARGAIAACLAELKELQSVEVQQKRDTKDESSGWWRRGG